MDRDTDTNKAAEKDRKLGKSPGGAREAEDDAPVIGPYNPALGEIYQQLYPEIRRPKPNQEAIAAALKAMQRLTMKMDSETAVADTASQTAAPTTPCPSCGHHNREGNKFCGMCGVPATARATEDARGSKPHPSPNSARTVREPSLSDAVIIDDEAITHAAQAAPEVDTPEGAAGPHYYHHHYHHHYFQGGVEGLVSAAFPRANAPESAREADRMRIVAAAKGEPMSRSEAAVRRLTQEWVLACNTRQLDELLDLYAPDALVLRSNIPLLRGAAAVREFFFSALESGLGEVAVEPIRVEVLGDLAHEVGRYSALVPGTAGKRREERGKYLWVFAKQSGGEWKLISECWSSDLTLTNAESDIPTAAVASAKPQPRR